MESQSSGVQVMEGVSGVDDRTNTLVYFPPQPAVAQKVGGFVGHVVYVPGDIQNFAKVMLQQPSCQEFVDWSYEATLTILSRKFLNCHLWLVVPSKKVYQSICVYKNFVKSESILGIPSHTTNYNGLAHLELLLANALSRLESHPADDLPIALVGFSKGCIVLNQVLYELSTFTATVNDAKQGFDFGKRISLMVWLDGGHSGETDVWVTDPEVISSLICPQLSHVTYSIHVTPYQVKDESRPWKGEAESQFTELLHQNDLQFNRTLYFADEVPTIETHFKLLLHFNTNFWT